MQKKKIILRSGLSLIEVVVTTVVALIVIFGIGIYVVDMQRGYGRMYGRVHGMVADAHVAQRAFESIVRKSAQHYAVSNEGRIMDADYWERTSTQILPDCHARFYVSGEQLMLESGPTGNPVTQCLCLNVSDCMFYMTGSSVQMVLTLDDGGKSVRVISSAVQHND